MKWERHVCPETAGTIVMLGEATLRQGEPEPFVFQTAVVACGLDRHQRAYVLDGLRQRAECLFVDTFDALDELLRSAIPIDALILTPEDATGRSSVLTVERVAREWPDVAIVIFCPPRMDQAPSLRGLVLAGAHQLVFEGMHDTASALATAVETSRREVAGDAVYRRLQPLLPDAVQTMAQMVLARPDVLTSVAQLANTMGVHRKTLVNRCARAKCVQPAELIVWCRLAMVAHMLERTGATVESIALTLGFPSHTSLRNQIKRKTGRTATAIRREGGLGVVVEAMRRDVARARGSELPIQ